MMNRDTNKGRDKVFPGAVQWGLGTGAEHISDILWRCDASCAGKLYSRTLFGSREEAEEFVQELRRAEPDHVFNVEAIKASSVWN
jgi:hypothetical protein